MEASRVERFVEHMLPAVIRAAGRARALEGQVRNVPKIDEASPEKQALTRADLETQEIVLETLFEAYPDVALAAEEATETAERFAAQADACVVVDPIDGTLWSYLEGQGPYSVVVGLAVDAIYRAGVVALPREGVAFDGTLDTGAFVTRPARKRRPVRATADSRRVLLSNGIDEAAAEVLRRRDYEVMRASGGAVSVAPLIDGVCAGLRHSDNDGGISIRGRVGVVIARAAGALVSAGEGADFPRDMETFAPDLLIAANPADLEVLEEARAAIRTTSRSA
ncbi:MAG: inositol monophosphatase family protein [Myxococcota bacterium]|nr:inositol monophosphatase family protein [Myxococcota bacterium]